MNNFLPLILLLSGFLALSSCNDDDDPTPPADYSDILDNTGENVILKTYETLASQAAVLQSATQALENNPSQANLDAAKAAWVATRSPWEQSEGFLFGPVDQEGIDPSIDSWPVNVTDLNNVLASGNELTESFLAQQEGTLKGFHTIEFLLWGETGDKQVGDITPREFEYLAAASGVLASDAQQLYDLWKPSGGNFISNILNAGNGSQVYISQKSALEEITNAMIIIADEVGNGKINDPFVQQDLTLEESRFSANSKADFADNIRSIKNIYTGVFDVFGNEHSVSDIIAEKNATLDVKVRAEIDAAIQAIETIPGTFSDAVFNNQASVAAAQQAVRGLQATLEEQVLPIISNL
jgi:putative iron-regulated protein